MKRDYGSMELWERPFACDGLTVNEIMVMYRDGAKKGEMIGILSDLCATDRGKMRSFLEARGMEVPKKREREKGRERLSKRLGDRLPEVLEMLREKARSGGTIVEASREIGEGRGAVRAMCIEYGIIFSFAASERAERHKEKIERGRELASDGKTAIEAAKIMGICKKTAYKLAKEGGYEYAKVRNRDAWEG